MADAETVGQTVLRELGTLGGLAPEIAGTVIIIFGALIRLIRSNGDTIARQAALFDIAEEGKAALDREKFPGQEV